MVTTNRMRPDNRRTEANRNPSFLREIFSPDWAALKRWNPVTKVVNKMMTHNAARKYVSTAMEQSQNPARFDLSVILRDISNVRVLLLEKVQGQACVISVAYQCEPRVIAVAFRGQNCGVAPRTLEWISASKLWSYISEKFQLVFSPKSHRLARWIFRFLTTSYHWASQRD